MNTFPLPCPSLLILAFSLNVSMLVLSIEPPRGVFHEMIRCYGHYSRPATGKQRRLKSARLVGEYEKPWIAKSPYRARERWDKAILWAGVVAGFLIGVPLCYLAYENVPRRQLCLIMDDNFNNLDNWSYELEVGGFGTDSFEWTTNDPLNAYVSGTGLHIMPTLTLETTDITPSQLVNGYTLNVTGCTSNVTTDCVITSNATTETIINPVRSARITTKGKKFITYGRVEVLAKMPVGDWLWPAIWMMPEDSVYGEWPRSGEIDILESRGNDPAVYGPGGRTMVISTTHWGLSGDTDMYSLTTNTFYKRRGDWSQDFHVYGLEWSENYLYTYIDNRLLQVLSVTFGGENMWARSGLGSTGYSSQDPWSQTGRDNTPFDEAFYLILNIAIGGTGGYFPDGVGNKPWVNWGAGGAASAFWKANATWLKTWGAGRGTRHDG